ncbi:hypothetical protein [Pseudomonas cerasi]
MTFKNTSFVGLVTFDASGKHTQITEYLSKRGYYKNSLNGREISFNTYIGTVDCDVKVNENGAFPAAKLKKESDRLADNLRESLHDFFSENDIDGSIYVMFSWKLSADDSTSQ